MAARPYWKGHLKLSLVSCPIALYPAVDTSERVAFRQVNRSTGNRLRHRLVDSVTGEAVDASNKARGYEVGDDKFVVVEEEELDRARAQARASGSSAAASDEPGPAVPVEAPRQEQPKRHDLRRVEASPSIAPPPPRMQNPRTIEIERFIPRTQLDARYYQTPYYIAPRDPIGQEAFAVIREAMAARDVVGTGRIVLFNRERPVMVEPMGLGLRAMTLRYAHEIRNEAQYFVDIPETVLPKELLEVAEHIVDSKTVDFDPAYLEDRYRTAVVAMLREKKARIPPRAEPAVPSRKNVINLMELLQRSLTGGQPVSPRAAQKRTPRRAIAAASKGVAARRAKVRTRRFSE